jgi:thiol-disulfide isomerase/thioredoxin
MKIRIIQFISIVSLILVYNTSVEANGPPLFGPMKKFQLTPTLESNKKTYENINWKNSNNETISLENFKGKVIFVNFWATWCLPCIRELPSIERLQSRFNKNDFAVIAISLDRGGKKVAARLLRRLKLKKIVLYFDKQNESAKQLGVKFMPTTFIFDQKSRKLGKLQGGVEWDNENAVALIKFFIDNPGYADRKNEKNNPFQASN